MTKLSYLSNDKVVEILQNSDLRHWMAEALDRFSRGVIEVTPRVGVGLGKDGSVTHLMLARDMKEKRVVTKLIDYDPSRPRVSGRASYVGLVTHILDGEVVFVCPANGFTAVRTAGATTFVLDKLARPDTSILVLAGAGPIARHCILQMNAMRPLKEVRIVSKGDTTAHQLASELKPVVAPSNIRVLTDLGEAARGAEVIITATSAVDPILFDRDVSPGQLIAAIGSGVPERSELEAQILNRASRIYVEDKETAWREGGDLLQAQKKGLLAPSATSPMVDLLNTADPVAKDEIVVYKSVGMSWQDMACAKILAKVLNGLK